MNQHHDAGIIYIYFDKYIQYIIGNKCQSITYSDTEAGDSLLLTVGEDILSERPVVRLPVGDDHHHLGGAGSTAVAFVETPLTEERRRSVGTFELLFVVLCLKRNNRNCDEEIKKIINQHQNDD